MLTAVYIRCACKSCRTTSGSCLPAQPYVQIPFDDIHPSPTVDLSYLGSAMTSQTDLPHLTRYNSSSSDDQIARYFCSTCGASILYFDGSRDFLGTFAAGLIDSKQNGGALAQSWLSWWTGVKGHPVPPVHCPDEGRERWGVLYDDFERDWVKWGASKGSD